MSFDWAEYYVLAKRLRQEDSEAARRTAISRAYYSVFCQARDYLLSEGVILSTMGPSSHKQVWGEFKYRGRTHRSIWLNGDKLHYNRIQADYVNEIKLLDLTVNESFEMAERIVYYLNQIIKLN